MQYKHKKEEEKPKTKNYKGENAKKKKNIKKVGNAEEK